MKYVFFTILFAMFTYMGVAMIHDHYYLSYDSPDPTNVIVAPFKFPNRFPTPDNMTDEEWAVSVERGELVKAYYKAEKVAATADASNVTSDAITALQMFQPTHVDFHGGTLKITLPQPQITEQIYLAVITTGICFSEYLGGDLSAVNEVVVLNQHSAQGYVYETGIEDCERINNVPAGSTLQKTLILGETHWY
jgi:hypothetical protein